MRHDSATEAPPFRRIAATLAERIATGELRPGDRVPSTREITRDWGVAMATASKALAELRRQGLVTAAPGVGTVVVDRATVPTGQQSISDSAAENSSGATARRRSPTDTGLTREQIVTAAMAIADREGLAAVTMRRVAVDIGAATMSLYRHVPSKDELLVHMLDAAIAEHPLPAPPPAGWRPALELAARTMWSACRCHPWLAAGLSLTRPQPVLSGMAYTEWVMAALDGVDLPFADLFTIHLTLFNYVRGTAINLESEADAEATSGLSAEQWLDAQQPAFDVLVEQARFRTFDRLFAGGYDFDLDGLFESGLRLLLDGLAARLDVSSGTE